MGLHLYLIPVLVYLLLWHVRIQYKAEARMLRNFRGQQISMCEFLISGRIEKLVFFLLHC